MTHVPSELERALDGAKLSETSRATYKTAVRGFVTAAGRDPSCWTPERLDGWLRSLAIEPQTKNVYLAGIKRAARRWAALHKTHCFADAVEGFVVTEQKHPRTPEPLDHEQLGAMFRVCARADNPMQLRDRALLAVALHTGFRRRELARIEMTDLDHRGRSIVTIAKRGKRHRVRVSADCWARLDAWVSWLRRRHIGTGRVFRSLRRCLDQELSWCVGPSMRPESVWRTVKRLAKQAGIRMRVCTHSLRHSLVAALRDRGVPEIEIARRIGHASTATTALYGRGRLSEVLVDVRDDELPT